MRLRHSSVCLGAFSMMILVALFGCKSEEAPSTGEPSVGGQHGGDPTITRDSTANTTYRFPDGTIKVFDSQGILRSMTQNGNDLNNPAVVKPTPSATPENASASSSQSEKVAESRDNGDNKEASNHHEAPDAYATVSSIQEDNLRFEREQEQQRQFNETMQQMDRQMRQMDDLRRLQDQGPHFPVGIE